MCWITETWEDMKTKTTGKETETVRESQYSSLSLPMYWTTEPWEDTKTKTVGEETQKEIERITVQRNTSLSLPVHWITEPWEDTKTKTTEEETQKETERITVQHNCNLSLPTDWNNQATRRPIREQKYSATTPKCSNFILLWYTCSLFHPFPVTVLLSWNTFSLNLVCITRINPNDIQVKVSFTMPSSSSEFRVITVCGLDPATHWDGHRWSSFHDLYIFHFEPYCKCNPSKPRSLLKFMYYYTHTSVY